MSDIDKLMQEEFLPFYKRTVEAIEQNHHAVFSVIKSFLSGQKNHVGLCIAENDTIIGKYTMYLDGPIISRIDNGVLSSEFHIPFGIIRPYVILEKSTVQKMIQDEQAFIKDPFTTKMKYARDCTIKFL